MTDELQTQFNVNCKLVISNYQQKLAKDFGNINIRGPELDKCLVPTSNQRMESVFSHMTHF